MRISIMSVSVAALVLAAVGCAPAADEAVGQATEAQQTGQTVVTVVTEPGALAYLDAHGYSFAERFAGVAAGVHGDDHRLRSVGDPFEVQTYGVGSNLASADPFRETGPVTSKTACVGGGATGRANGFPFGGICSPISDGRLIKDGANGCPLADGTRIALGESAFVTSVGRVSKLAEHQDAPRVVCGAAPYQDNVSRTWRKMSTAAMIWESCAAGLQIACDEDHPCRDEYVCMRGLPDPARPDPKKGTCMPGYVLAQLEIDAHKVPGASAPCLSQHGKSVTVSTCP